MGTILLQLTAVIYLLATGSFILYLFVPRDPFSRLSPLALLAGFIIHTIALGVYFVNAGYPAVTQLPEALSFYSWLMVAVYLLVQLKYRLTVLGCLIGPLAFLMSVGAFTFGTGVEQLPPSLRTYWLPLHVTLALLGNAVFALAFGVSVLYLLQEYKLKSKKSIIFYKHFPSLDTLDRLNYVFLVWGFPFMTLGIIT